MHVISKCGYLSICSGVGDFNVSATSQFNPLTHMVISSSDVAKENQVEIKLLKSKGGV